MRKIKIGIGVITYKRQECLNLFLEQLDKNPPYYEYERVIEYDNISISRAKNNCLWVLRGCDYIFLFEDDCFPIAKWWDLPFIRSGYGHSMFMNKSYAPVSECIIATKYKDCSGVFLFMDQHTFKKVGYFNEAYDFNGLEHVGYSDRLRRASNEDGFVCLNITDRFIYSLDLQGVKSWGVFHKSTMGNDKDRMLAHKANRLVLEQELKNEKLYYESSLSGKLV